MCSLCCPASFSGAHNNIKRLFDKNKKRYQELSQTSPRDLPPDQQRLILLYSIFHYFIFYCVSFFSFCFVTFLLYLKTIIDTFLFVTEQKTSRNSLSDLLACWMHFYTRKRGRK